MEERRNRGEREKGRKSEKYCSLPFATALIYFSSSRTCLFIYLICMQLSSVECNENDAENKPNSHGITFIIRTFHSIGNKTQWQYYLLFSDQHASPCKSLEQLQFVQRGRVFIYIASDEWNRIRMKDKQLQFKHFDHYSVLLHIQSLFILFPRRRKLPNENIHVDS